MKIRANRGVAMLLLILMASVSQAEESRGSASERRNRAVAQLRLLAQHYPCAQVMTVQVVPVADLPGAERWQVACRLESSGSMRQYLLDPRTGAVGRVD